MFCSTCGNQIDDNSTMCPYCGTQLESEEGGNNGNMPNMDQFFMGSDTQQADYNAGMNDYPPQVGNDDYSRVFVEPDENYIGLSKITNVPIV